MACQRWNEYEELLLKLNEWIANGRKGKCPVPREAFRWLAQEYGWRPWQLFWTEESHLPTLIDTPHELTKINYLYNKPLGRLARHPNEVWEKYEELWKRVIKLWYKLKFND